MAWTKAGLLGGIIGAAAVVPGAAMAQVPDWTQGWSGQVTIYAWLPSINGAQQAPSGEPLINLDTSAVLSALDMAFMGAAEVRKDKFGLLFDAVYADLGNNGEWAQGHIQTSARTRIGMYTAAASYRVYDSERSFVDLYGGARYFDTSASFGIATDKRGRTVSTDLSWTDGIIGVRGGTPLSENWSVTGFADVGGFDGASDLSWEVYGGANYAFSQRWVGTIGYRYVSVLYQATDRAKLDINIQGPLFGVSYKF